MRPEVAGKRRGIAKSKFKSVGDHNAFLSRIRKSLYYGQLPSTERFSFPVTELATELFSATQRKHSLQRLELDEASYLTRSACVSPCSLVLALLYVERLQSCRPCYLRETSPSELYLVSLLVATKFLQDDGEDDGVVNEEWAISAGITTKKLNQLEREFLQAIDWEVYVSEEAFWTRLRGVEREVALSEGVRRGWFSYSDLDALLEKVDLASLAHTILTVSAVCLTSYTASVLTLIASTLFVTQLQPFVGGLGATTQVSSTLETAQPTPISPDVLPEADATDPTPSFGSSPVDVLTTSFILASINCNESFVNESKGLPGYEKGQNLLLDTSFWLQNSDRLKLPKENQDIGDIWISEMYEDSSWTQLLKYLQNWLNVPITNQWNVPLDWASSVSYFISKSPGIIQAPLYSFQVS